jgi:hypothetical protein
MILYKKIRSEEDSSIYNLNPDITGQYIIVRPAHSACTYLYDIHTESSYLILVLWSCNNVNVYKTVRKLSKTCAAHADVCRVINIELQDIIKHDR